MVLPVNCLYVVLCLRLGHFSTGLQTLSGYTGSMKGSNLSETQTMSDIVGTQISNNQLWKQIQKKEKRRRVSATAC